MLQRPLGKKCWVYPTLRVVSRTSRVSAEGTHYLFFRCTSALRGKGIKCYLHFLIPIYREAFGRYVKADAGYFSHITRKEVCSLNTLYCNESHVLLKARILAYVVLITWWKKPENPGGATGLRRKLIALIIFRLNCAVGKSIMYLDARV